MMATCRGIGGKRRQIQKAKYVVIHLYSGDITGGGAVQTVLSQEVYGYKTGSIKDAFSHSKHGQFE